MKSKQHEFKKIVIVDDDVAILDSLGLMLDFEGFEVNAFERGSEIFTYVESVSKPDIILLDMWLSGEDGRDICKKLKENETTKNIPVVIMSASRGLEQTALQSGANAFIAKPFEIDEVVDQLHKLTT
ncbi:response regulator [Kaistella anthropi]|nr:response regulator [Kaistella anthropi]